MLLRFLAIIGLFAFAIYWFHIRLRPKDLIAYNQLIQESTESRTRRALEESPAHQVRQGVQKDIWAQDETRHLQIQSEHSELTLSQKKDKIEAIEQLKNIRCTIQDDITLTADEGIYTFPSRQFIAQKNCRFLYGEGFKNRNMSRRRPEFGPGEAGIEAAKLEKFSDADGSQIQWLPDEDSADFSITSGIQQQNQIDGTRIHLDLIQEIAIYENPKGYLASGPLYFTADQLIWYKKEDKLILTDRVTFEQPGQFSLIANRGTLILSQFQPQLLVLEGNVRLLSSRIQGKESHAIADTLTYNPLDKTFLFSAAKKVLFWQEGLSLSASEVLIRQNQTVEGHGDVHFAFDLEEQNYIDEFFKRYL